MAVLAGSEIVRRRGKRGCDQSPRLRGWKQLNQAHLERGQAQVCRG